MAIPLFWLHAKCLSWYWVGRSGWKKKIKKNHKKFWNRRPWYPRTALKVNFKYLDYQIAQYTVKTVHVFVPVFLNPVTMLIFQIKIIILSEKWVNYLVTTFFFWKCQRFGSIGRWQTEKKKRMASLWNIGLGQLNLETIYSRTLWLGFSKRVQKVRLF